MDPSRRRRNLFKVEEVCAENFLDVHFAEVRFNHLGFWLKSANDSLDMLEFFCGNAIDFIQDNRVAEFNLLNKKACKVFFVHFFFEKLFSPAEFCCKAHDVHNGNDSVQMARKILSITTFELGAHEGDRLSDRERFTDSACFNQDVIEFTLLKDLGNLFQKVRFKGAANAAVRQRNHRIFLLNIATLFNQGLVNVYFANIIDNHSYTVALLVAQNMVQKCSLASSEVTGEECDRYGFHVF